MKKTIIVVLLIILSVICFWVTNQDKKVPIKTPDDNLEQKVIFQANLPDIGKSIDNNIFIIAEKTGNEYKNILLKIKENDTEKEIKNKQLEDVVLYTYEDELRTANKNDYFVVRKVKLNNDPDIGIVHEHLDSEYFRNSSGYILDEKLVAARENICVSTSSVYNNWACFVYDSQKEDFILSYAQNFVD